MTEILPVLSSPHSAMPQNGLSDDAHLNGPATSATWTTPPSHIASKSPHNGSLKNKGIHKIELSDDSPMPFNRSTEGRSPISTSSKMTSPRCEAFVMTGEKMLNLNPKISSNYAKIAHEQLPPSVDVDEASPSAVKRGPFDDFPSMQHKLPPSKQRRFGHETAVPASQSEHFLPNVNGYDENGDYDHDLSLAEDHNPHSMVTNIEITSTTTLPGHAPNSPPVLLKTDSNRIPSFISAKYGHQSTSMPSSPAKKLVDTHSQRRGTGAFPTPEWNSEGVSTKSGESLLNSDAISRLANRLFELNGFKRNDVAAFLMKPDDFSLKVTVEYLGMFNFAGIRLDAALREFLDHVCLTGESSERARILLHFATRYHECNPALFVSSDQIHALTCALILLNTDLHGPNPGKKMSSREFINNLAHTQYPFERNLLKTLYSAVKESPFTYQEEELKIDGLIKKNGSTKVARKKSQCSNKKASLFVDPKDQIDYKHGWVMKKSVYDSDGKRTPFGRRKWQMYYATIRGMVIYLHKNEKGFEGNRFNTFNNCILLHHAMAEIPKDYNKRKNVFRLRTANFGELLLQSSEPSEVSKWIDAINYVSAAFSTPALPAPASSMDVPFHKPLLPSAPTHLSIPDQLRSHMNKLEEMSEKLTKLRENAPSIKTKGKPVYDYFYRERYLDKERERYTTYVHILREKLSAVSQSDLGSSNPHFHHTVVQNGGIKGGTVKLGYMKPIMHSVETMTETTSVARSPTREMKNLGSEEPDEDRASYKDFVS